MTTIFAAPAKMEKGAAPAPLALVMSTATVPLIEVSLAADDTTCSVMVATRTAALFADEDAAEPTMSTVDGGLPTVHEKRYADQSAPATHPVADNTSASMVTLI